MKHSEQEYLDIPPFADEFEGLEIRCHTRKIVKVRKPQICNWLEHIHPIPVGERVVVDRAIIDGNWDSAYSCFGCLEKWLDFNEGKIENL